MHHLLFGFTFTFVTAAIVIAGDYVIKLAADGNQPMWSVIGAFAFGESLHAREYAGLGCALLAMVLMSRLA